MISKKSSGILRWNYRWIRLLSIHTNLNTMRKLLLLLIGNVAVIAIFAQRAADNETAQFVKDNYTKIERMVPMRDGVRLFTAVYIPKDSSQSYPFLLMRTPYSVRPYGESNCAARLGPSKFFTREKYIFVMQDVRGRYMSEGVFREM